MTQPWEFPAAVLFLCSQIHTMIENKLDKAVAEESRNRQALDSARQEIAAHCTECRICVKQCAFLAKYGTPKNIAASWEPQDKSAIARSFACSLCGLCTAVCPVTIDPRQMFLEMRRYAAASGNADYTRQRRLLNFEKRGTSKRYSFYGLPAGCDTVLFPGCALAGSRPQRVMQLFDHLQNFFPNLGIVLDCCTKPSHDLGRSAYFHVMFSEMQQYLVRHGIKNILVACPSCYAVFHQYSSALTTRSVYEILARETWQADFKLPPEPVTIQDSCVARFENATQDAVRRLVRARGVSYEEMKHHGKKTLCCGEGGGAHFVAPGLAGNWAEMRRSEVDNRRIITYCAGCAHFLGKVGPTAHLLDLLFDPVASLAGRARVAKAPFTYLHRLLLKWKFKRKIRYNFTRERNITPET
jgi:Fe-S oxidoreductase